MRAEREPSFRPEIRVSLTAGPPTMTFEDNGRGIAPENRDQVFKIFFSLKDTKRRRGLGLYIAREAAQHNDGTLDLENTRNPETDRLHRFVLELPASSQG
jgi:signal transduction histidine kinase